MKVSIITSCYNRAETIQGAIESVLAQDYPEIEYIIVDGASRDGSLRVIRECEEKAKSEEFRQEHPCFSLHVISEPDHGMYEALNKGIRMATGDIIGLVHSDDFLYDCHVISEIVKAFETTGADFIYGDGIYVDAEDMHRMIRNWRGGGFHRWKVRCGWLPLHPTCYIRRDVMMREELYDETYRIAADSDLLVRYLYEAKLKVHYLKRRIIRMRMGGLSTDSGKRKLMWNEDVRMYKSHGFSPIPTKIMKMMWKVPQFVEAKFIQMRKP
ncbi:MAG: glycosyltransferase family 2 protein [Prevotellaceae bacterium]|nr:glycosyltransferase family 2 protein [Prevotellaceae bacterium]